VYPKKGVATSEKLSKIRRLVWRLRGDSEKSRMLHLLQNIMAKTSRLEQKGKSLHEKLQLLARGPTGGQYRNGVKEIETQGGKQKGDEKHNPPSTTEAVSCGVCC